MLDKVKKKFVPYPKGREVEEEPVTEIKKLISHLPLKRDLLIEYLHLEQWINIVMAPGMVMQNRKQVLQEVKCKDI